MSTIDPTNQRGPKPRRRHGLGADGIEALRSRQGGKCAICRKPETKMPGGRLAVDHDHAHCHGKIGCPVCVRGLLCVDCNNLLRVARDDQRILRAAIEYMARPRESKPRVEDLPVTELLRRLRHGGPDPRLMPRQGRRDRFLAMMLDAPAAAATVAEGGWMLDNDPQGYRDAIRRADRFYGGPGALNAHLAAILPQTPEDLGGQAFFQEVAVERAKLGMSSPGMRGGQITLGDINAYLRAKAQEGSGTVSGAGSEARGDA
jgi:hypothetical protein